ncbi:esterase/lipase family protein [Dyadobacter pollutisoli]|uniref:Alpha/beta hydrolase n=1 Tax=Dyadobacter pollutisoli TaxID=2910158 RepID=A0A9E8SLQ3_9BACT|nr:alpha/beta hydrolase [Dyadobacter pollutisoli]WAC12449.1 alpha/beta hydrolase [Dyadobacter pollutisoli]
MSKIKIKFEPDDESTFFKAANSSELVILLHATAGDSTSLRDIKNRLIKDKPHSDIWFPNVPTSWVSFANPIHLVKALVEQIDAIWEYHAEDNNHEHYKRIILIGHSIGALFARKIYVYSCGENSNAPFERKIEIKQSREWAIKIERIILLAAMNRGWSARDLSILDSLYIRAGVILGKLVMFFFRTRLLLFQVKKGASFIIQLRIQWLAMVRAFNEGRKREGGALVIQLLGTVDDIVSPEDNVDLVTGGDFVYLEVPKSSHSNVVKMGNDTEGEARYKVLRSALLDTKEELLKRTVVPLDAVNFPVNTSVTDVIFVIHGIRDRGFWTQKIANRIKLLGDSPKRKYAIETSSYGYFPMLSFLLPSTRRAKVEWLMDQYTEDLALYPNADFSYVGHSNGTYLLAQALEDYPACHFKNVLFAGSVVPTTYKWNSLIQDGRVKSILNYVASADWVVAIFPNFFQKVPFLGVKDIGGAGHEGFTGLKQFQIQFVSGSHGAAINEDMWGDIADFAVNGKISTPTNSLLIVPKRSRTVAVLGYLSPLVWLLLLLLFGGVGFLIWSCIWSPCYYQYAYVYRTIALILYCRFLWFVLTKV